MAVDTHPAIYSAIHPGTHRRDSALDFTKGALVVLMVIYHWLNYFSHAPDYLYRYLRFITPSFIFIAGFLVTHGYAAKHGQGDSKAAKRLFQRGFKLVGIFTLLNLGANIGGFNNLRREAAGLDLFDSYFSSAYVVADGRAAAFQVLVPIGYLLILCSGILALCRHHIFRVEQVCAAIFLGIAVLDACGVVVASLELIGIGCLGVALGNTSTRSIHGLLPSPARLGFIYCLYSAGLAIWGVVYPLQVAGVCLSLSLVYLAGRKVPDTGPLRERVFLLGRYSLLAYIVQIGLLQILRRVPLLEQTQPVRAGVALVATLALTLVIVESVDFARKLRIVDRVYRFALA